MRSALRQSLHSLTHEASLHELDNIRQQIQHIRGGEPDTPIVVVGTKMDLYNEREVTSSSIQELVTSWKLPFYETSAKKSWNINEVFEDLTRQMRKRYPNIIAKKKRKKDCLIM
ncbi:hypothetical protein EIP86_000752 [Pleurotus ostreatoroseus]|nr:hypothetical protein EIP86_000752 [Pleurotus ostreatoroseus]